MTAWIDELIAEATAAVRERSDERVAERFERCFADTLHSTMTPMPDGTVFMLTGDIPAMWLRDSSAQLAPYLHFAADRPELADLLVAVNRRQLDAIALDPYANAFNAEPNGHGHHDDRTDASPWVWERKYEIDSLCYPLQLARPLAGHGPFRPPRRAVPCRRHRGDGRLAHRAAPRGALPVPVPAVRRTALRHPRP